MVSCMKNTALWWHCNQTNICWWAVITRLSWQAHLVIYSLINIATEPRWHCGLFSANEVTDVHHTLWKWLKRCFHVTRISNYTSFHSIFLISVNTTTCIRFIGDTEMADIIGCKTALKTITRLFCMWKRIWEIPHEASL